MIQPRAYADEAPCASLADGTRIDRLRRYARLVSLVIAAIGVLTLIGWALDITVLEHLVPGQVTMKANTAIAFVLSGIALWSLLLAGTEPGYAVVVRVCGGTASGIAVLTLVQYVSGLDFGIDQLLTRDAGPAPLSFHGRMAPAAALNFLLLGAAMVLLSVPRPPHRTAQVLVIIALVLAATAAIGYGCRAGTFNQIWTTAAMALHTAVTFVVLSTGILAATAGAGVMTVVSSRSAGGTMFRKLWLPSIGTLLLLGFRTMEGERSGLYGTEAGVSMMLMAAIVILTALFWRAASQLDRVDAERERAVREVRDLNQTLAQRVLDRTAELTAINEELETFTYSVSHDLRAPLRAIDGFAELLSKTLGSASTSGAQAYLERIRANAGQMDRLIQDLLALARIGRHAMVSRTIDTPKLVDECLATLRSGQTGRNIQVLTGDLPECRGDPALLKQVWMNLIENAFKFTSKCTDARIEIAGHAKDDGQVFCVRDNGVGFDMRYAGKLFKAFQRLHGAHEFPGTGVGLAIVKRILRHHGGRVWAEAVEGEGATFYFTLRGPAAHAA
jgi:signal transduction histidine kinase